MYHKKGQVQVTRILDLITGFVRFILGEFEENENFYNQIEWVLNYYHNYNIFLVSSDMAPTDDPPNFTRAGYGAQFGIRFCHCGT